MTIGRKLIFIVSIGITGLAVAVGLFLLGGETAERWSFVVGVGAVAFLAQEFLTGDDANADFNEENIKASADARRVINMESRGLWVNDGNDRYDI